MRPVFDPPDEVGIGFSFEGSRVCQGGEALSDHFGVVVILFELNPFGLLREFTQFVNQTEEIAFLRIRHSKNSFGFGQKETSRGAHR